MARYLADLYDDQDLIDRDTAARDCGLAFTMSATSGRYACEIKADSMEDAIATLHARAAREGWAARGWRAHVTRLNERGHRVVRWAWLDVLISPADYRHVTI